MNRATLLLALAVAAPGAGCYSSPSHGDVTLYWDFVRFKLDGTTVTYDSSLANPARNGTTCLQSGVDFVGVTFPDGTPVDPNRPTLDCVLADINGAPIQGATFGNFTGGAHQFVVTGYRTVGGTGVPIYQSSVTVNVTTGRNNSATVDLAGIPDHLVLNATLTFQNVTYNTCGAADVQRFDVTVVDSFGTPMTASPLQVSCQPNEGPGVDLGSVDLDTYTVTMDAVRTSTGTDQIIWSTCRTPVDHYGNDTLTLVLPYGVCT